MPVLLVMVVRAGERTPDPRGGVAVRAAGRPCPWPVRLPVCDTAERDARRAIGMPARHPEQITRDLPGGQEKWLAALAAALWPADEYAVIIAEMWRHDQR